MGSRKWDYSKTFARFLAPVSCFCRDSFGLPHNDASCLWSSRSPYSREGKGRVAASRRNAVPRPVVSRRVASRRVVFRPFRSSGGLIVALTFASRVSALPWSRKHRRVNNTITAKVTRIDSKSSRPADGSFAILRLLHKIFNLLEINACRLKYYTIKYIHISSR